MDRSNSPITRRAFLKSAAGAALGAVLPPMAAAKDCDLAVISGGPAAATARALEALGGISRFGVQGRTVVLKPNMSFSNPPEWGSTTHPEVVAAVAQACMEGGARRVLVLDHPLRPAILCLKHSGIQEACRRISGVHVLAVEERKFFQEAKVPGGQVLERVEVLREVLDKPVLINLPQAKSHSNTGVSLGIKNLMGLIWDRFSFHSRYDINQALADLASLIRPQLTILDATRALVSGGPGGPGEVVRPQLIIAGTDPVAVDSYGVTVASWYGRKFSGRQIEHLVAAQRRGLGRIDLAPLKIFRAAAPP